MNQALWKKMPRIHAKLPLGYGGTLAALGLATGAVAGGGEALSTYIDPYDKDGRRLNKEELKKKALTRGLISGITTGLAVPLSIHFGIKDAKKALGVRDAGKVPSAFKNISSQQEAKRVYRNLARQHHPDRGGDAKKMRELIEDWKNFQKHPKFPKTAMAAFVDEMMHILHR